MLIKEGMLNFGGDASALAVKSKIGVVTISLNS